MLLVDILIALLPVLLFLLGLLVMDSFKLMPLRTVAMAIAGGVVPAVCCAVIHYALIDAGISTVALTRYIAPVTEESAKGVFIAWLLVRRRVGFAVDAAIAGFAVGTGFGVAENLEYLRTMPDARIWVWIVRGLGTAILHGSASSVFAMIGRSVAERHPDRQVRAILSGWVSAVVIHGAYNVMLLPPLAATLVLLTVLPIITLIVFRRSEAATHEWVTSGLDLDVELLQLIASDQFVHTRFGAYLAELKERIRGPVVADMFCLLRVEIELAIQAKAMLLARQAGLRIPVTDDLRASLAELSYLESSIGRTGLLALTPLQVTSDRDRWHRYLMEQV